MLADVDERLRQYRLGVICPRQRQVCAQQIVLRTSTTRRVGIVDPIDFTTNVRFLLNGVPLLVRKRNDGSRPDPRVGDRCFPIDKEGVCLR